MSGYQWKYDTNFNSYGAFESKLLENTFVAFIVKHTVVWFYMAKSNDSH